MPKGLSPLARGNLGRGQCIGAGLGPIPARAGEPYARRCSKHPCWAYPRSRGGTDGLTKLARLGEGLSPLARGNLGSCAHSAKCPGPIPARAGEPTPPTPSALSTRAYPRSRGGTHAPDARRHPHRGLSPLARGNRRGEGGRGERKGPIPARAGEPRGPSRRCGWCRAYPRSRGGTQLPACG